MRVAVIGSRGLTVNNLEKYLPADTSEIISGGARGVDGCARAYAQKAGIPLKEFLPEYRRYGRCAPIKRNLTIIENADMVIAFWDSVSHGTKYVINTCLKKQIPIKVYIYRDSAQKYSLIPLLSAI